MVDIHREGCSQRSVPQKRLMAHLRRCTSCTSRKPSGRDRGGNKSQPQLGVTALTKHLVTWAAQTGEEHKTQAQSSLCLCGVPENLNLSCLDLGSALNPGHTSDSSWQSNLEPELCRLGKHTSHEQGTNPVWPRHWEHSPQMPVIFVCSVPPSPQHDWTSEPKKKKWPPPPPCVRVEIRH